MGPISKLKKCYPWKNSKTRIKLSQEEVKLKPYLVTVVTYTKSRATLGSGYKYNIL